MSKFDEVMEKCKAQLAEAGGAASEAQLTAIAKALGPSIYNQDSLTVAGSDESELDTVRKNFIAGKLGVTDPAESQAAIDFAIEKIGKSNRNKYRPVVYALIAEKLGKLSNYG